MTCRTFLLDLQSRLQIIEGICRSSPQNSSTIQELYSSMYRHGLIRMSHFVHSKNLPFSVEEVRSVTCWCIVCAEPKRKSLKPPGTLIKDIHSFERLNTCCKGPLPSFSQRKYPLTVVDEYPQFPFAFALSDMSASTVTSCFSQSFALFGMPLNVRTDRGKSFMSEELVIFFLRNA